MQEITKVLKFLGLNQTQIDAYMFIWRNKEATLKNIADGMKMTSPGAMRMLEEMIDKGFIKKFKTKGKKLYMLADVDRLHDEIRKKRKEEDLRIDEAFETIKATSGVSSIKIVRLGADIVVDTIKSMVKKCKNVFEFIDKRNIVNVKNTKIDEYKYVNFHTLYFDSVDSLDYGYRIYGDSEKKYAHVLAFDNKVKFTNSTKETVLIENKEIYNTIVLLIETIERLKKTSEDVTPDVSD